MYELSVKSFVSPIGDTKLSLIHMYERVRMLRIMFFPTYTPGICNGIPAHRFSVPVKSRDTHTEMIIPCVIPISSKLAETILNLFWTRNFFHNYPVPTLVLDLVILSTPRVSITCFHVHKLHLQAKIFRISLPVYFPIVDYIAVIARKFCDVLSHLFSDTS